MANWYFTSGPFPRYVCTRCSTSSKDDSILKQHMSDTSTASNSMSKGGVMKKRFKAKQLNPTRNTGALLLLSVTLALLGTASRTVAQTDGQTLFITSAVENPDGTATFPLHRGTSHGQNVFYVILDASDGNVAQTLGVNTAPKLANARGTAAVQKVTLNNGVVNFPATVDFSPDRVLTVTNGGFPPTVAKPGAIGEPGYSPLIQMPNGTILNAPQIARDANGDGRIDLFSEAADKVISIDLVNMKVTYRETRGFQGDNPVRYASFDASDPLAATLEDVTYAPALNKAPTLDDDSTASARALLIAFINGQTGANNPERQGLTSAVRGEGDPLNLLRWNPGQGRYSPLWDVHLAEWTAPVVAVGQNFLQTDVETVEGLISHGLVTGPGGARFGASGFIVNCPIVVLLPKP